MVLRPRWRDIYQYTQEFTDEVAAAYWADVPVGIWSERLAEFVERAKDDPKYAVFVRMAPISA